MLLADVEHRVGRAAALLFFRAVIEAEALRLYGFFGLDFIRDDRDVDRIRCLMAAGYLTAHCYKGRPGWLIAGWDELRPRRRRARALDVHG